MVRGRGAQPGTSPRARRAHARTCDYPNIILSSCYPDSVHRVPTAQDVKGAVLRLLGRTDSAALIGLLLEILDARFALVDTAAKQQMCAPDTTRTPSHTHKRPSVPR